MVLIQIKQGDQDTFLYECLSSTTNDAVIRDLVRIWNNRMRLFQLCGAIRDLGEFCGFILIIMNVKTILISRLT